MKIPNVSEESLTYGFPVSVMSAVGADIQNGSLYPERLGESGKCRYVVAFLYSQSKVNFRRHVADIVTFPRNLRGKWGNSMSAHPADITDKHQAHTELSPIASGESRKTEVWKCRRLSTVPP